MPLLAIGTFCISLSHTLLGNARVAIAVVQSDLTFAMEKRVKDVAVAVLLPPRAQLSIPHAVQTIDETRMLVAEQRVKVLVAQVTLEVVLAVQSFDVVRPQARLVQLGPPNAVEIEQYDARIKSRIAVLGVFLAVLGIGVRLRLAGDCGRIVRFAKVRFWVQRPEAMQNVVVDGRQFGRQTKNVFGREPMAAQQQIA